MQCVYTSLYNLFQVLLQYACVVLVETKYPFGSVFAFLSFLFFFFFFPAACFDFSTENSAPMHCSQVLQILLFSNFFIKNEFHGTIHTFKIYFTTVFSVFSFSKISSIQTDPKSRTKGHHKQKI